MGTQMDEQKKADLKKSVSEIVWECKNVTDREDINKDEKRGYILAVCAVDKKIPSHLPTDVVLKVLREVY